MKLASKLQRQGHRVSHQLIPYGVYDVGRNLGWVSVGIDQDTASFAVESIRRWWQHMGQPRYPKATRLLVTADGGGSNSPIFRQARASGPRSSIGSFRSSV